MSEEQKINGNRKVGFPIRNKLLLLVLIAVVPLLCVAVYLMSSLVNYSEAYDAIVRKMTVANQYNISYKENMDESVYKLAVGYVTFDGINNDSTLVDPYTYTDRMCEDFSEILRTTSDNESRVWIQSLLRNAETLKDRIDDLQNNLNQGGQYEENIEMLDNNIYILTELIQEDIQYYLYYQTESMVQLKTRLNSQIRSFLLFVIVVLVVIIVAILITAIFILRGITKSVDVLCDTTQQIAQGDFAKAEVKTNDELSMLSRYVNDMSDDLSVLVDKIKEDERKMRQTELRLLQEQINPHFLYNTLDTIVWLIDGNNSEEAMNMVISLSDFFRMVLNNGKEIITIREEEQHIRSYLQIQQVRYRDILEYEIDFPAEIYEYQIQKLTLQPLVENSLYHGIKYKRAKGKITVSGYRQDDKLYLTVADTGVGMDEEELEKIRKKINRPCKEGSSGFGLANVNERIRMNYGSDYGMQVDSTKGEGTTITIVLPAVLYEVDKEERKKDNEEISE